MEFLDTLDGCYCDIKNKELIALISRDDFELDWQETEEQIDEKQILLQEKLFEGFKDNAYKALFHLGFTDRSIPLPDSVHFLRSIAATFSKALSKSPEIEFLREKIIVEPESEEIGQICSTAIRREFSLTIVQVIKSMKKHTSCHTCLAHRKLDE